MFNEMKFLFEIQKNGNSDSSNSRIISELNEVKFDEDDKNYFLSKSTITTGNVKNFIKNDVNRSYGTEGKNPYLEILKDFDGEETPKSLKLKPSDFAYLRDIGVLPINRLMILRRFPEGVTVPRDLNDLDVEPISTVVGWVPADKMDEFLDFSVNEEWVTQGSDDMIHLMINKIVTKEFGLGLDSIKPMPGWGIGIMFNILNKMGLTSYGKHDLPIGDPNVLKESVTRPHESFGLKSDFKFNLNTTYEQKHISNIDMTSSTMDILLNALNMGTSDVRFIGNPGSDMVNTLKKANEDPTNANGWFKFISSFLVGYIGALGELLKDAIDGVEEISALTDMADGEEDEDTADDKVSDDEVDGYSLASKIMNSGLVRSVLASTVARYQWPLRGSLAMFTGESSTPWHLSIGNPYSPLLSMNNIKVDNLQVKFGGDMMYNDIPKYMDINISLSQGRSMGKNEIYDMFGIRYKRNYHTSKNN